LRSRLRKTRDGTTNDYDYDDDDDDAAFRFATTQGEIVTRAKSLVRPDFIIKASLLFFFLGL